MKKLIVFYTFGLLFSFLVIFELAGLDIDYAYNSIFYARASDIRMVLLSVVWGMILSYAMYELYLLFARSAGEKKIQFRYLLIGFVTGFTGAVLTMLPWFGFVGQPYPVGNVLIWLYLVISTYAIVRHKLFDIEVIIKKTLVFAGLFVSAYILLISIAFLSQNLFQSFVTVRWLAVIPSVLIVIFALKPLEKMLVNITDKFLFQKKYDYKDLLKVFTEEVLTVLDLNKLVRLTVNKLVDIVRVESCAVLLRDNQTDKYYVAASHNIQGLTMLPVFAEEVKQSLGAEIVIPIALNDKQIGILSLGKKKSDKAYTADDMDILLPLSRTLAIAISNAEMFEELGKAQAEAAQKEKMAVIGTLAAGMAHEIRNPITTIKIFTEFLKERKDDPRFIEKFEHLVPKEVAKINDMITHLLEFSKPADYKVVEDVNIKESLKEVLEILGAEMVLNDIVLEEHVDNLAPVRGNKKYVQEALFNLIQNAIHAIERRGRIAISAEDAGRYVDVKIFDTGCGIAPENIAHIFKPFFTTKMNAKGVGLGLYVIKQLMLRMSGDIAVESVAGRGTTFSLRFIKAQ